MYKFRHTFPNNTLQLMDSQHFRISESQRYFVLDELMGGEVLAGDQQTVAARLQGLQCEFVVFLGLPHDVHSVSTTDKGCRLIPFQLDIHCQSLALS